MIEFCNKRRMIYSIIILGIVTILILILEEALTKDENDHVAFTASVDQNIAVINHSLTNKGEKDQQLAQKVDKSNTNIDEPQNCKELKPCSPCSEFEVNSKSPEACIPTGYKVTFNCDKIGKVYKSCSRAQDFDKRNFYLFESLMLLLTVVSYGLVKLRTSQLERKAQRLLERKQAQDY